LGSHLESGLFEPTSTDFWGDFGKRTSPSGNFLAEVEDDEAILGREVIADRIVWRERKSGGS
jgi:hypothetical protein